MLTPSTSMLCCDYQYRRNSRTEVLGVSPAKLKALPRRTYVGLVGFLDDCSSSHPRVLPSSSRRLTMIQN